MKKWILAAITIALVATLWRPAVAANEKAEKLIEQMTRKDQRAAAVKELIALGGDAVPDLLKLVDDNTSDRVIRGWAIVCLSEIKDARAATTMHRILKDQKESSLYRLWAAGALLQITPEQGLSTILEIIGNWQAGELQEALNNLVLETVGPDGAEYLINLSLTSPNQNVRRTAVAFLGSEKIDSAHARTLFMDALAFDAEKAGHKGAPWKGGPLFIPAVTWSKEEARDLICTLNHWMLWAQASGNNEQIQVVRNNLVSVAANHMGAGWNWNATGIDWAIQWTAKYAIEDGEVTKDTAILKKAGALLIHCIDVDAKRIEIVERLRTLSGEDHGKDTDAWRKWLATLDDSGKGGE
jgi:hypothetical protein